MIRKHFQYRTTIATILAEDPVHIDAACDAMVSARHEVERCIAQDPYFAATFEPYAPDCDFFTVQRMVAAAAKAGVGPMAAVAGTIAWAGVEAMVDAGAAFGVVDNGGDIALVTDQEIRVGVHAGASRLSNRIAFVVPPQERILGICTSSATVGHSISLGTADAVTIFSSDVSLADAFATALCNRIRDCSEDAFAPLADVCEVTGALVIIGDECCRWGTLPPLVRARVDKRLITRG